MKNAMNGIKDKDKIEKGWCIAAIVALTVYIGCILIATLSNRSSAAEHNFELKLFWSYIRWLQGDDELGREIILNIGLFAPLGFLSASALKNTGKRRFLFAILFGLGLSVCIEMAQFLFHLGLAELDDVVSNSLGTTIGATAEWILCVITKGKLQRVLRILCSVICVIAGILGCLYLKISRDSSEETLYGFCLETLTEQDGKLVFTGFEFPYDMDDTRRDPVLLLTTNHLVYIPVHLECGLDRPEVSEFYFGDHSRQNCGYMAQVSTKKLNPEEEYDLMILWPGEILPAYTGQHFSVKNGQWVSMCVSRLYCGDLNLQGSNLADLQQEGELLYYYEQYGTYIVQDGNCLYMILEKDKAPEALDSAQVKIEICTSRPEMLTAAVQSDETLRLDGIASESCLFTDGDITEEAKTENYRVFYMVMPEHLPIVYMKIGLSDPSSGKDYWSMRLGMDYKELHS